MIFIKTVLVIMAAAAAGQTPPPPAADHYGPGVDHDISVISIDTPASALVTPASPLHPAFSSQNFGNYYEDSLAAYFEIRDSLGVLVYLDSMLSADSLAPDSIRQMVFGTTFTPESLMKYTATAFVTLAGDEVPYNDTLQMEFATFEYTGSIQGIVTDDNAGGVPLDGAVVTASTSGTALSDTTVAGSYFFANAPVGSYTITAAKPGYFDSTVTGLEVTVGSILTAGFSLGYPTVDLSPAESVSVVLDPGSSDSSQHLVLDIGGTRDLQFTVEWPEQAAKAKSLGDSLWGLDLTGITGDNLCLGAEFDGAYLWVTGAANDPAADPNYLYKLAKNGILLDSFPQPSGNGWGWRDLCFDGAFLYAAAGDSIEQIDPDNGTPTGWRIYAHTSPCRGLAYDPAADCFYTASYADSIRRINRDGSLADSWPNSKNIFGLAWDATAPGGPWLWAFSQDGSPQIQASQFDPRTGAYTGLEFQCPAADPVNACAGGAAFSTSLVPGRGVLLGLLQDATDRLVAYDLRPHNAPWLSLSKTGGNATPPAQDSIGLTFSSAGLDSNLVYRAKIMVIDQAGIVRDSVAAVLRFPTGVEGRQPENYTGWNVLSLKTTPNPFARSIGISFQLNEPVNAGLRVYNVSGQLVKVLINEQKLGAGEHHINWDGTGGKGQRLPSGVYLFRLQTGQGSLVQKAVKMH